MIDAYYNELSEGIKDEFSARELLVDLVALVTIALAICIDGRLHEPAVAPHQPVILSYPWLKKQNPNIDWETGGI